jgi:hypothetical protein
VLTKQSTIDQLNVFIGGFNRNPIPAASFYSMKKTLSEHGIPDHILVNLAAGGKIMPEVTGYQITVFYIFQGFSISYRGAAKKIDKDSYQVCYSDVLVDDEFAGVELTLASPSNSVLERILNSKNTPDSYYYPIEKAFGVGIDDFYHQVIQNDEMYCLRTPHQLWP